MSAPKTQPAVNGLWSATSAEYHGDCDYISHSMLEEFRDSIPRYAGLFVTKTIQPEECGPALNLGTAVHAFLLQPDQVNDLLIQLPPGDGRTKEVKEARERVRKMAGNRTVITAEQWEQAQRMADSARAHPLVREMVELDGYCEQSVRVECPETGKRKARFDKLFYEGHILDIKTTRHLDPKDFSKDSAAYGYHRQAAFYEDVRDLSLGPGKGVFLYVVICSVPPWETIVYQMDAGAIDLGRMQNRELLYELRKRQAKDDWSSRWAGLQRLDLPAWAYAGMTGEID